MESTSNEGKGVHLHTLVDHERKLAKGMVMMESYSNVIRITDVQVLNGQHLRVQHTYGTGDVSSFLIQQGREERLREMAPAAARRRGVDGAAVLRQNFAKHYGGGGARGWCKIPPLPPLYIGVPGGAPALVDGIY